MIAIGTLNLPARKLLINLQVLAAMRTGKFEIAHLIWRLVVALLLALIIG
jgi:hypothetical protein